MQLFNSPLTLHLVFCFIPYILAAYITFPLYIGPSPSAWAPLYSAVASNPRLLFQLIINPNSGPGSGQYPTHWLVHVSYCNRNITLVESDVSTYAGWSKYTGANIHLDGIFFDEAPESYTTFDFSYLTNVMTYARAAFGGGHLNLNPGTLCDSRYFALVDTINVFESPYSAFNTKTTINSIPAAERSKSTVMIYSFSGNTNQQASLVTSIASSGVSGMYITTTGGYSSFSKYSTQFVSDVAATG